MTMTMSTKAKDRCPQIMLLLVVVVVLVADNNNIRWSH